MAMRVILSGILGGIGMYVWESAVHMSPLGMIGIKMMPQEGAVAAALKTGGAAPGLYLFPGAPDAGATAPSGLLVYHSSNVMAMSPMQVGGEFLKEIAVSLILAFLMAQSRAVDFSSRLAFATAAGLMVTLSSNISYLIWYGFPVDFTMASIVIDTIGYIVAGAIIAKVLPRTMRGSARAAAG